MTTKMKLTEYTLDEFLTLTVEIVYRNGERLYRVLVPGEGDAVGSRTLSYSGKKELYTKLTA